MIGSLRLWKKNYYLYQSAMFISLLGDFLGIMALHWWILKRSEGMAELSSIFLVGNMVSLISLPLLGPIGDRFCRKNILNFADTISCLLCIVLAVFIYNETTDILLLCLLTGLLSFASSLFRAGSFGMIPELVPTKDIAWAISQNQIVLTLSIILGGGIGSLFISIFGIFWTVIINALTIAIAIILIKNIDLSAAIPKQEQETMTLKQWGRDFIAGLQFIGQEKILLMTFLILVLLNTLLTPFDLILPYYVQKVHLGSVWQLGLVESSIGIGSVIGSLIFSLIYLKNHNLLTILSALAIIAISFFFFGMAKGVTSMVMFGGLIGFGEVLFFIPVRTKLALMLPHHFRSRVGVIFAFGQQIGKPLAITTTAFMIKSFAVSTIFVFLSALILALIPLILLVPFYAKFLGNETLPSTVENGGPLGTLKSKRAPSMRPIIKIADQK